MCGFYLPIGYFALFMVCIANAEHYVYISRAKNINKLKELLEPQNFPRTNQPCEDNCDFPHNHHHNHDHNYPTFEPDNFNLRGSNVEETENPNRRNIERENPRENRSATAGSEMLFPPEIFDLPFPKKRREPTNMKKSNCSFGLCDDVEDYPSNHILSIINRSPNLQQYFNATSIINININNRNQFDEEEETLCSVRVHTKFPRSARNTRNVEKTIVNLDEFKQGVVFETCGKENGVCRFSETFPQGYVSSCKQKRVIQRMMILNELSNKEVIFDNFEVPSCCVCTIRRIT